ncbi:MAG TPA: spore germination protein GerW family protein [Anaerolineae bacterium]
MTNKIDFNRFFDQLDETRRQASVDGVFGTPIEAEGKTVIPIASAVYGFGMGGGLNEKTTPDEAGAESTENMGGGAGSGYLIRPMAMAVVDKDGVRIEPIVNSERIVLAGMLTGAWVLFWIAAVALRLARRR